MRRVALSLVTVVAACQMGEISANLGGIDAPVVIDAPLPGADAPSPSPPDARIAADAKPHADAAAHADAPAPIPLPDAATVEGCLPGMVRIGGYCIDAYEAYVVELVETADGIVEMEHSPYYVVDGLTIRAKVAPDVVPQGYISQIQSAQACANAGKRLCSAAEFSQACRGPDPSNWYPYGGQTKIAGACNEGKGSTVARFFGNDPSKWTYAEFNDPILNQWDGGLARTGAFTQCVSPVGVHDCVGNLHEWGSDPPDTKGHGRFRGGFYGDAEINGHGCLYVTSAHELAYHDYSTGFRCCMDAGP